jgi:hypothetical protein
VGAVRVLVERGLGGTFMGLNDVTRQKSLRSNLRPPTRYGSDRYRCATKLS